MAAGLRSILAASGHREVTGLGQARGGSMTGPRPLGPISSPPQLLPPPPSAGCGTGKGRGADGPGHVRGAAVESMPERDAVRVRGTPSERVTDTRSVEDPEWKTEHV